MSVEEVIEDIEAAFPPRAYHGQVTPVDGEPFSEEIDDDLALYECLYGKDWKSVPSSFIDVQYSSLSFLTSGAFLSFFPAWLIRSLDFPGGGNIVREFVLYSLAGRGTNRQPHMLQLMTPRQRNVVRKFLEIIPTVDSRGYVQAESVVALQMLDKVES